MDIKELQDKTLTEQDISNLEQQGIKVMKYNETYRMEPSRANVFIDENNVVKRITQQQ